MSLILLCPARGAAESVETLAQLRTTRDTLNTILTENEQLRIQVHTSTSIFVVVVDFLLVFGRFFPLYLVKHCIYCFETRLGLLGEMPDSNQLAATSPFSFHLIFLIIRWGLCTVARINIFSKFFLFSSFLKNNTGWHLERYSVK